jgi:hypothetical protein
MAEARVERRFGDLWALKSLRQSLVDRIYHIALDEVRPQTAAPAAPAHVALALPTGELHQDAIARGLYNAAAMGRCGSRCHRHSARDAGVQC